MPRELRFDNPRNIVKSHLNINFFSVKLTSIKKVIGCKSEYRKIRTRKKSLFGNSSRSDLIVSNKGILEEIFHLKGKTTSNLLTTVLQSNS